jgi:hypothetical protein
MTTNHVPETRRLYYGCLRDMCFEGEEWRGVNPNDVIVLLPELSVGVDGIRYTGFGYGIMVDRETLKRMYDYAEKEKTSQA